MAKLLLAIAVTAACATRPAPTTTPPPPPAPTLPAYGEQPPFCVHEPVDGCIPSSDSADDDGSDGLLFLLGLAFGVAI
jgi:hypothetical protein